MKIINIITLGCSKNLVDSEVLATALSKNYKIVFDSQDKSDIVVINTCGFILDAKQESIDTICQYAEQKKQGLIDKIFVFGCLSERYKKDLIDLIPEVDSFYGVNDFKQILLDLDTLDYNSCQRRMISTPNHTAYIKLSEGCNRMCSFCAIPYIRGRYTSRTIEDIVGEVSLLADNGTKEFNLIAQDLSYYGKDNYKKYMLKPLIEKLIEIDKVHWLRMHYTYPNNFPLETLEFMKNSPKLCNYLDIPIQHINDRVLEKMKRGHSKQETIELISKFREIVPDIALRTSIMVGFPGETDKAFEELIDFIQMAKFDRLGVFAYCPEEGTYSYQNYKDRISKKVKQGRADYLMKIQQKISLELNAKKIGKTLEVLVDRKEGDFYIGRTQYDSPDVDNEVLLPIKENDLQIGEFYNVEITDVEEFDLYGKVKK